jgi:hypothetical protein
MERYTGPEDEEEDVSSYWVTLREREDTGNWKRKPYIAVYGDFQGLCRKSS